jgi:hypothetical protein
MSTQKNTDGTVTISTPLTDARTYTIGQADDSGHPLVAPMTAKDAHTPDPANYTRTAKVNINSTEQVHGRTTDFHSERKSDVTMDGEFDNHVMELVNGVLRDRQVAEDKRADKRNFNRMLTLLGALVIGLFVTYSLSHGWYGSASAVLAPYSFTITILLDSSLAAYSYIRKY